MPAFGFGMLWHKYQPGRLLVPGFISTWHSFFSRRRFGFSFNLAFCKKDISASRLAHFDTLLVLRDESVTKMAANPLPLV